MKVCKIPSKGLAKQIKSLVNSLIKLSDVKEQKEEYIKGLRLIKSQYANVLSDDLFFDEVSEVIQGDDIDDMIPETEDGQNLRSILEQGYQGELSTYDPNFVESTLDNGSKLDEIDSTPQEKNNKNAIKEHFLVEYFPMSSDARLAFQQRFKENIIQRFFFNEIGSPRTNLSNSEMDKSVKTFREDLIKYIDDYLKLNYPKTYESLKNRNIQAKIRAFKELLLDTGNFSVNPIELIKIPTIDLLTDESLKSKLQTYMAYIALSNFDELIADAFDDSIVILHKGNYSTDEIKYRINLGNRSATTWNDDSKDIDETEQIGSVIRLYMESLNMYDVNGKRLPFKMTFSDVKSGIGGIMDLFNSYNVNEKTLSRNYRLDSLLNLKKDLKSTGLDRFYKNFDEIYNTYIKGKTIGQLIAKTKQDPALLMPLLFTTLVLKSDNFFENRYQIRQSVRSLWENLFNMNNDKSLLNRVINSGGINLDAADLYSFVTTLFVNIENIPVIEYKKDSDKSISAIELKQNTSNSRLNSQKYTWAGKYNAELPQSFKTFNINDFQKGSNTTKINLNKTDLVLEVSGGENGVTVIPKYKSGKSIGSINTLNNDILDFLSEVFDKPITKNYLDIYTGLGGKVSDLLDLAGTILYNYKVGKVVNNRIKELKVNDPNTSLREFYDREIKDNNYYGGGTPDVMRDSLQPELIGRSIYPPVRRFSLALDIQQGYSGDTTAKDGQGKQIALKGLSSLMSKYMELVQNYNLSDPESILKNFTIYDTFENAHFVRDYAGADSKKQATQFSEAEFFAANFLYDFYGEQVAVVNGAQSDIRKNNSEESTKFRIMGPVVSDKNKLPKLQFDWNSTVKLPSGEIKKFYELTPDEIIEIQNKEFGDYYQGVHKRITDDWLRIQPYIAKYIPGAILDFNNDFEIFNDQCKKAKLDPFVIIHNALADYQKEARQKGISDYDIRITDNFHYIKGGDKEIHNNPSLFHQLSIYGRKIPFKVRTNEKYLPNLDINTINETPEEARQRLNYQLISELLQYNINIKYGDKDSNIIDNASYAAELYNEKDVWRKGKTIIFGKILGGNNPINLSSLRDFRNWNQYKELQELYRENLPENLNINSPKFELESTLRAINVIHKYNLFRFKNAKKLLIDKYIKERKYSKTDINEVIKSNLRKKNPTWHDETIERKAQEYINGLTKEQILEEKVKWGLESDLNLAILSEIKGESSEFEYDKRRKYIEKNLENNDENSEIFKRLNSNGYSIQINPEIERYQTLNNWLGESYMLTSVGTFIAHPGDKNAKTIYNYEYGNFGQQVKRNVSQTATKHREVQNSLKGIRSKLRIAFIDDEKDSSITFKGDYDSKGIKVHDGATWYNGTMVDLDNNSLGADAMGEDKKPFIHAIDPRTGCAIIVKTAGFAVTNSRIQSSKRFVNLNKKMNDSIKWSETLKKFGYNEPYFDWTVDFNGNDLDLKEWYVQRNGRFFKYYNPRLDENGITTTTVQEVYVNGEPVNVMPFHIQFGYVNGQFTEIRDKNLTLKGNKIQGNISLQPINSNWELWNVFGGAYSAHFIKTSNGEMLTSINDNGSFQNVNYIMNHTGRVKNLNSPIISQSNVVQILKESQIDMIPTMGAGKFGATNINSTELFDNETYVPTYMEVFSDDFGEQLDAEHTAEGGHVSLMTQVINALGARGYSKQDAEECYQALENLAEQAFEEAFDNLNGINNKTEGFDLNTFKIAIANIMLQTFKNTSISDGNILSALSQGLKQINRFNNPQQLEGIFPISSPQIYAKAFSKLASSLEKASVRLKFEGGMLVLNPSNRIFKIINGKLSEKISRDEALQVQADYFNNPIATSSQIKIGRNYFILNNKTKEYSIKFVDGIDDFNEIKSKALERDENNNLNYRIFEAIFDDLSINENSEIDFTGNLLGRDLATYDCVIGELGSDRTFSLYDLDVVKQMFGWNGNTFNLAPFRRLTKLEEYWNSYQSGNKEIEPLLLEELNKIGLNEINPKLMRSYLERNFQNVLNSISKGIRQNVTVDGQEIKIDKSKTIVSPYEAILPMIYKTSFGLKDRDTVGEIEQDQYFFVKRFVENSTSKFYSQKNGEYNVDGSEFDFELKRTSGDHIYIVHPDKDVEGQTIIPNTEVIGETLYRVDDNGNKMYQLPSTVDNNGKIVPNCKIKKLDNGVEVIETTDFLSILEQGDYTSIAFGNFKDSKTYIEDILLQLEQSTNKTAQAKTQYVLNAVIGKVKINREGLQKGDRKYLDSIGRNQNLVDSYSKAPETVESIEDIFNNDAYLNALEHHELYTQDALNQQTKLIELLLNLAPSKEVELQEFLAENPYMKHIIDFGKEQHTSFLTSLEAVVSRTPAQSHQSFMAMKVAGFDTNLVNSIYVNRMQLYLQGSDYDIDKANLLGLKFYNGKLVTWSPYYDLTSIERARLSESLPFPSGRRLIINDNPEKIPFNVIEKDYQKLNTEKGGFLFVDNNGNSIEVIPTENGWVLETNLNSDGLSQNTYLIQHAVIKNLAGEPILQNDSINPNVFIQENGIYTGKVNINEDIKLYLQSLDLSSLDPDVNKTDKFNNLTDLGTLIRTFTKLGEIPSEFEDIKYIVDKHNAWFSKENGKKDNRKDRRKRDALYNFISIKTKNISKDPINLIQGQSGIDVATDDVKNIVKPGKFFDPENPNIKLDKLSSIPTTSDNRSIIARMHQLVLTLTGKENVGIVASAMKVFEAMSHHYNKVLSEGTLEEQERLISKIKILGKELPLVANSFTKNRDTLLNSKIEEAYNKVDNFKDAFIMMSALLSLATDNAKDPTLSKLNATPETIGCYTAGLVLGLSVSDVAELLISDTGILLANMVKSNVFNPKNNQFNHLSDAIRFIRNAPKAPESVNLGEFLEMFGIWKPEKKTDKPDFNTLFWSKSKRSRIKQMAMFLLHSSDFELETDLNKIAKRGLKNIKDDPHYWGWNEEKQNKYDNRSNLSNKQQEKIEKEYKEYQDLVELKKSYEAYLEDPDNKLAQQAKEEIEHIHELNTKNSTDEQRKKVKALMNSTIGVKEFLESIFEWINYHDIVDQDKITKNGVQYSILNEIRKLNSFNEEMGDLRSILKLNQGLPNSVQDQHNWINNFRGILSRAANRQNRKIKEESDSPLANFQREYGSLELDLNLFLNNPKYQKDAIEAYESTKVGVNILDVVLNVPHYRGYMKTMNLLYEGGKAVSFNYNTQAKLTQSILPKLNLKNAEQRERFFKTLNPVIFERINNNFLWQTQTEYEIPKFKLENGELIEIKDEKENLQFEVIRLGTPETNQKFKDYFVHYVYPYLKENYPDNAFVQAITLRTYGYNLDHQITVNVAKRQSYNINNLTENVQFNEIKKALMELNGINGLIKAIFYYNLIAYNGQPGSQSLTDLFEDFLVYDTNKVISDYNNYITYLDESNTELFNEEDEDYLLRVLAPEVFNGDNVQGMSYIWITNPENNKKVLLRYKGELTDEERAQLESIQENSGEEPEGWDDNEWDEYSRYSGYRTLKDVLTKWLHDEWVTVDDFNSIESVTSKKFVFGKEILQNPDLIFDSFKEIYKRKRISELTPEKKNEILNKLAKDINLSINGKLTNLSDFIEILKPNHWSKEDIYNAFQFVSRKSRTHSYDVLVSSTLKHRLEFMLNNDKNSC